MDRQKAKILCDLLKSTDNDKVNKGLREIKKRLLTNNENLRVFRNLGLIHQMLKLIQRPNEEILNGSLSILSAACVDGGARTEVYGGGGVRHLFNILKCAKCEPLQMRACRTIANQAQHKPSLEKFVALDVINKIIDLLNNCMEDETKTAAIRALRLFASNGENCQKIVRSNGIKRICSVGFTVTGTTGPISPLHRTTIKAISHFSRIIHPACISQIMDGTDNMILVSKMWDCGDAEIYECVLRTVLNLVTSCFEPTAHKRDNLDARVLDRLCTASAPLIIVSELKNRRVPAIDEEKLILALCKFCEGSNECTNLTAGSFYEPPTFMGRAWMQLIECGGVALLVSLLVMHRNHTKLRPAILKAMLGVEHNYSYKDTILKHFIASKLLPLLADMFDELMDRYMKVRRDTVPGSCVHTVKSAVEAKSEENTENISKEGPINDDGEKMDVKGSEEDRNTCKIDNDGEKMDVKESKIDDGEKMDVKKGKEDRNTCKIDEKEGKEDRKTCQINNDGEKIDVEKGKEDRKTCKIDNDGEKIDEKESKEDRKTCQINNDGEKIDEKESKEDRKTCKMDNDGEEKMEVDEKIQMKGSKEKPNNDGEKMDVESEGKEENIDEKLIVDKDEGKNMQLEKCIVNSKPKIPLEKNGGSFEEVSSSKKSMNQIKTTGSCQKNPPVLQFEQKSNPQISKSSQPTLDYGQKNPPVLQLEKSIVTSSKKSNPQISKSNQPTLDYSQKSPPVLQLEKSIVTSGTSKKSNSQMEIKSSQVNLDYSQKSPPVLQLEKSIVTSGTSKKSNSQIEIKSSQVNLDYSQKSPPVLHPSQYSPENHGEFISPNTSSLSCSPHSFQSESGQGSPSWSPPTSPPTSPSTSFDTSNPLSILLPCGVDPFGPLSSPPQSPILFPHSPPMRSPPRSTSPIRVPSDWEYDDEEDREQWEEEGRFSPTVPKDIEGEDNTEEEEEEEEEETEEDKIVKVEDENLDGSENEGFVNAIDEKLVMNEKDEFVSEKSNEKQNERSEFISEKRSLSDPSSSLNIKRIKIAEESTCEGKSMLKIGEEGKSMPKIGEVDEEDIPNKNEQSEDLIKNPHSVKTGIKTENEAQSSSQTICTNTKESPNISDTRKTPFIELNKIKFRLGNPAKRQHSRNMEIKDIYSPVQESVETKQQQLHREVGLHERRQLRRRNSSICSTSIYCDLTPEETLELSLLELIVRVISQVAHVKEAIKPVCREFVPRITTYLSTAQVINKAATRMLVTIAKNPLCIQPLLDSNFIPYVAVELGEAGNPESPSGCKQCTTLSEGAAAFLDQMVKFFNHVHQYGQCEVSNRLQPSQNQDIREGCIIALPHVTRCPKLLHDFLMCYPALELLMKVLHSDCSPGHASYMYATAAISRLATMLQLENHFKPVKCEVCLHHGTHTREEVTTQLKNQNIGVVNQSRNFTSSSVQPPSSTNPSKSEPSSECKMRIDEAKDICKMRIDEAKDITFKLKDGSTFPANREFLAGRNEFFSNMLTGSFSEGSSSSIDLPWSSRVVIEEFIHFLHGCNCDKMRHGNTKTYTELLFMSQMYMVEELYAYASRNLISCISSGEDIIGIYESGVGRINENIMLQALCNALVRPMKTWKRAQWLKELFLSEHAEDIAHNIRMIIHHPLDMNRLVCNCDQSLSLYRASESTYGKLC